MAITYTGSEGLDTFTLGSNKTSVITDSLGIDTIHITKNQTMSVESYDKTANIVFDADVTIESITTGLKTTMSVNGQNMEFNALVSFQIGDRTFDNVTELNTFINGAFPYTAPATLAAEVAGAFTITPSSSTLDLVNAVATNDMSTGTVVEATGAATLAGATLTIAIADENSGFTLDTTDVTRFDDSLVIAGNVVGTVTTAHLDGIIESDNVGTDTTPVDGIDDQAFNDDNTVTITLSSDVTAAEVGALIDAIKVESNDIGEDDDITITLTDATTPAYTVSSKIEVTTTPVTAMSIGSLDGDTTLATIDQDPVSINANTAAALDLQGVDATTGTLTFTLGGDTDATDSLALAKIAGGKVIVVDGNIYYNAATISSTSVDTLVGTVSGNESAVVTVNLTAGTDTIVDAIIAGIKFDADDATGTDGERTVEVKFNADANTATATATISVSSTVNPLTTGTDTINTSGSVAVDVFGAATDVKGFLNDADNLDGGEGTDFLFAKLDGNDDASVAATIANIENITIAQEGTSVELDGTSITGGKTLTFSEIATTKTATVTNLTDTGISTIDASQSTGGIDITSNQTTDLTIVGGAEANTMTFTDGSGTVNVTGGATIDTIVMAATLNNNDNIDGKAGADTLSATLVADTTIAATIKDVQTITLSTAATAVTSTFDMADVTGTTKVDFAVAGHADDVTTLDNVNSEVVTVDFSAATGAGDFIVNFSDVDATDNIDSLVTVTGDTGANTYNFGNSLTGTAAQTIGDAAVAITAINGDIINGGAGADEVTATLSHDITIDQVGTGAVNVSGVETLTLTAALVNEGNVAAGNTSNVAVANSADATEMTAATTDDSTLTITGNLVAAGTTLLTLDGGAAGETVELATAQAVTNGATSLTINASALASALTVNASIVDGTNDTVATLTVVGSDATTDVINLAVGVDANQGNALTSTGVETINLSSGSDSTTTLDVDGTTDGTLKVTDTGFNFALTNVNTTVDASAAGTTDATDTLAVTVDATNSAGVSITASKGVDTLKGALGSDTFTMGANLTAADDIDGGAGTDTLTAAYTADADEALNINDVETIALSTTASLTVNAAAITNTVAGASTLALSGAGSATVTNIGAGVSTLDMTSLTGGSTVTINSTDLGSTNASDRDLTIKAGQAADTIVFTGDNVAFGNITIDNFTAGSSVFADRLDFGSLFDIAGAVYNGVSDVNIAQVGANAIVTAKAQGGESFTITLTDVQAGDLSSTANFVFDVRDTVTVIAKEAGFDTTIGTGSKVTALATAGDDIIKSTAAFLVGSSVVAGAGTADTLIVTGGGTLDIGAITALTTVEVLTLDMATAVTWDVAKGVVGTSGIATINGSAGADELILSDDQAVTFAGVAFSGIETLTVAAAVTENVTLTTAQVDSFTTAINFTGDGTPGTTGITMSDAVLATTFDKTAFLDDATLTLSDNINTITTVDTLVASGKVLTVDATGANTNSSVFTFDGSAETDGSFIINTAIVPVNNITGGQGNDTITLGATGGLDIININNILNGNDTITNAIVAQDTVQITGALKTSLSGDTALVEGATAGPTAYAIETGAIGWVVDAQNGDDLSVAELASDMTKVATAIEGAFTFTDAAADATANVEIFAVESDTAGAHVVGLYAWTQSDADDTTVAGGELTLLGTLSLDATLTAAEVIIG